jgi:hypothetical protein
VQVTTPALYAWYTEPCAFVCQTVVDRGTKRDAEEITRLVDAVLDERSDEVKREGGLLILHDWRTMKGYDADARAYMMDRVRSHTRGRIREMVIVIEMSPLFQLALGAANAFLVLATGRNLRTVNAVAPELIRYGIKKPLEGARFPGARRSSMRIPRSES